MADVTLGKKVDYRAGGSVEPISVANGTDTVTLGFVDDYSKLIITVTDAAGSDTVYEASLAARV